MLPKIWDGKLINIILHKMFGIQFNSIWQAVVETAALTWYLYAEISPFIWIEAGMTCVNELSALYLTKSKIVTIETFTNNP